MNGPLAGIRIIDLTSMVSGPLATMTLADQGAQVIKVEAPGGGDHTRRQASRRGGFSTSFLNNNRNKRSIILDLKNPEGINVLRRMVRNVDVMVQNFRPGVARRMGIGAETMLELNSRLVYLSIAGFGFAGPYAAKPVFDPLIQALSGLTTVQAGNDADRPRLVRTILPDKLTGIQASQAITAALFARERTGQGQHIELSMLDTVVHFLWSSDMSCHTFVGEDGDEVPQSFIDLIYETADGHVSIAVVQDKEWRAFAQAVDWPELITDPRFVDAARRDINKNDRLAAIQDAVRHLKTEDLLTRLEAADVPCAPILTRTTMIDHPQVRANGIVVETDHPQAGRLRQARHPAQFSATPASIRRGAPAYGAHGAEILDEFGFDPAEVRRLTEQGVLGRHPSDKD